MRAFPGTWREQVSSAALVTAVLPVIAALLGGCGTEGRTVRALEEIDRIETEHPAGIAVGQTGEVFVSSYTRNTIRVFGSDGKLLRQWGTSGAGHSELNQPRGVAVDDQGDVYVADTADDRVQVFDREGAFLRTWGRPGSSEGEYDGVRDVAVDGDRRVYALDGGNERIQVFDHLGGYVRE
jgi:DNA-binding beta-propeller fold protein YncE